MVRIYYRGFDTATELLVTELPAPLELRHIRSVECLEIIGEIDVHYAWNRFVNCLPWPQGCAFYGPDLARPGHYKPQHITWFGDDARFALANWRQG